MRRPNWTRGSLTPDEIIGDHGMRRWWILPQNRLLNVYLHQHRGDDDRLLHDHPAWNCSIRLRGELIESTPVQPDESLRYVIDEWVPIFIGEPGPPRFVLFRGDRALVKTRLMPRVTIRQAWQPHRLELYLGQPAWTLWIRGPHRRPWGFYTPRGWIGWREFKAWREANPDYHAGQAQRP